MRVDRFADLELPAARAGRHRARLFAAIGLSARARQPKLAQRVLGGLVLALPVTIKVTPLLPVGFLAIAVAAAAWRTRKNYSTALADGIGAVRSIGQWRRSRTGFWASAVRLRRASRIHWTSRERPAPVDVGRSRRRKRFASVLITISMRAASAIKASPTACGGWEIGWPTRRAPVQMINLVDDLAQSGTCRCRWRRRLVDIATQGHFRSIGGASSRRRLACLPARRQARTRCDYSAWRARPRLSFRRCRGVITMSCGFRAWCLCRIGCGRMIAALWRSAWPKVRLSSSYRITLCLTTPAGWACLESAVRDLAARSERFRSAGRRT